MRAIWEKRKAIVPKGSLVELHFQREIAFMFKIVRFPSELEPFFAPLHDAFVFEHLEYFKNLTLAMACCSERHTVSALHRCLDAAGQTHRSRFNNFLHSERWDPEAALKKTALQLLAALKPEAGETIELVIDDSKKAKRGQDMDALSWLHDPSTGRSIQGHQYVTGILRFRGHTIPWGIRLYVKKEDRRKLGVKFQKSTELAAALIREFDPPTGVMVRVLFDNFYLCPVVAKACETKGFTFISTLKSNRNLYRSGRKLKAGRYGKRYFSRHGRGKLAEGKNGARYRYHDAGWLEVSELGSCHVIFSRRKDKDGTLGIVTNDKTISARGMIETYGERWNIEVFFKDGKQLLGLGQYQNRSYRAAVIHLHLVCFAYALLTHIAITRGCAQGKHKRKTAALSTNALQHELRRIVWKDTTAYLKEFDDAPTVIREMTRLLKVA